MALSNIKKTLTSFALTGLAILAALSNIIAQDHSLLYKIEGNGIKASYLYGTIHILPQKDFLLKDKVKSAFDKAELIVMELDMDDPNMQVEMMKNALMEGNTSLDKLLDKEHYALLDAALKEALGVGVAPFNKMKPFMVSSMLLMKFIEGQPASFEGTFTKMAKAAEKEILGLETVTEQLDIFDTIPYQDQADDIVDMLDDPDGMVDTYADMIETYKSEDITEMYDLMDSMFSGDTQKMDVMLHNRNKNWIPKIGVYAKERSTFFGVGAGHLGGDQGVVSLLRKAGYIVTAVMD